MTRACFVILVHGERAPIVLGPMLEELRGACMRELKGRYAGSCLHTLDVTAGPRGKVTVKARKLELEGQS